MAISKRAAKKIADLINTIECAHICRAGSTSTAEQFLRNIDDATIALAELGIELVCLADCRTRQAQREQERENARRYSK